MNKSGWILSAILIVVIIYLQECKHCAVQVKPTIDTIITTDTVTKKIVIEKPTPYKVEVPITLPKEIDTVFVLNDYYSKYYYTHTIKDSDLTLTINDTISQNKVQGIGIDYTLYRTQTLITNTDVYKPKSKLFIGIQGIGGSTYLGVAPSLFIQTKKDHVYGIGYDVINRNFMASLYFKIKLKK